MFADTNNPDRPPDNTVDLPPIPNRAALYLGPADAHEDPDQDAREGALRRYAETVGLAVVAVYRDTGEEGVARLVEDARADFFDAVVVASRAAIASDATGDDGGRLRDMLTEVSVRLLVADDTTL